MVFHFIAGWAGGLVVSIPDCHFGGRSYLPSQALPADSAMMSSLGQT